MTMRHVIYGPGGYDPAKPDGNVVEVIDDGLADPEPTPDPLVELAEQVATLTDAVDTLILDSLGGLDV